MHVAVFYAPDGTVSIMRPADPGPPGNEAAHTHTVATIDGPKSPLTAGLPFVVIDDSELPDYTETDADGDTVPVRNAWRYQGGRVVVDSAARPPQPAAFYDRLLASGQVATLPAGRLADLRAALSEPALLTQVCDAIEGELTGPALAAFQQLRARKRL